MIRRFGLLLSILCWVSPTFASPAVEDAWSRATVASMSSAAVYATISNSGESAVSVTGVQTDIAASAMLHESKMEDGMMRMRHVHMLEIPPGERKVFAPGGLHVMLMGLKNGLTQGDEFEVTFEFSDGTTVTAPVVTGAMDQMTSPR